MNSIEQQVLRIIGENVDSPDVFTDTETGIAPIRDSISEAIEEINMLSGGYTETFTIPLVASQVFYRIKFERGAFAFVDYAWHVGRQYRLIQTDLILLNAWDPRWMIHSDTPTSYLQVGLDVIGFVPKPSSTAETVELRCAVIPSPYERDDERIKVRDQFRFALVNYAVSEYFAGRGDARRATEHYLHYAATLEGKLKHPGAKEMIAQARSIKQQRNEPQLGVSA